MFFLYLIIINNTMHTNKKEEIAKVIYELINQTIKTKNIITRGFKKIYDYKFFINAFIKRLKTGNTWKELEYEFKISDTHLNRVFIEWTNNNVFKNVYNLFLRKYPLTAYPLTAYRS